MLVAHGQASKGDTLEAKSFLDKQHSKGVLVSNTPV